MKIYYDIDDINFDLQRAITIGSFDGVHLGHQKILKTLVQHAVVQQLTPFVITFATPPKHYINGEQSPLLTPLDEKLILMQSLGVEEVLVLDFNEKIRQMSAHDFITSFILQNIGARMFVVGKSHSFGQKGEGNLAFLQGLALKYSATTFDVIDVDSEIIDNVVISSTYIRNILKTEEIETANKYLGYNYSISGVVETGQKLARTLGFPTANLSVSSQKLLPKNGVYLCNVKLEKDFLGLVNIGFRPTVLSSIKPTVEVHILDFNEDIYNKFITVELQKFIREEVKFNDIQALSQQIKQDVALIKSYYQPKI